MHNCGVCFANDLNNRLWRYLHFAFCILHSAFSNLEQSEKLEFMLDSGGQMCFNDGNR